MTPSTKVTVIYIRNNTFVPQELTVLPGTGITWINEDRVAHNVKTTPTTTVKFNSGDLMPGASFGYTFGETVGTYGFMDATTNATGRIIIKKGESFVGAPSQATVVPTVTTT
jgi:plastocyanin